MKRFVFFLALTLLLGTPLTSSAATESDPVHVKAEIDKAFLTIGDLVTYTITIEHHPDTQILSSIPAPNEEFLEIKKSEDIYKKRKKAVLEGRKFTLAAYRVGEYILDPVVIRYRKMGENEEKTVQTNKLYLYVRSVAGDIPQEDIRDVKDVVPFVFRYSKIIICTRVGRTSAWLLGLPAAPKTFPLHGIVLGAPSNPRRGGSPKSG